MNCPICGVDAQEGGFISNGNFIVWEPKEDFEEKGLGRLGILEGVKIGKHHFLLGQTRVPNAYFCNKCNKVFGIFDNTYKNNLA